MGFRRRRTAFNIRSAQPRIRQHLADAHVRIARVVVSVLQDVIRYAGKV